MFDPFSALLAVGGSIVGGLIGKSGTEKAAQQTSDASRYSADLQMQQYQQSRQDLAPWRQAGGNALNWLSRGTTGQAIPGGGVPGQTFADSGSPQGNRNAFMEMFKTDPGYNFRMQQGVQALDRSAAQRGMLHSGAQAKAITGFGQDLGSQEYGNFYNRLSALAGVGQTATTATGQFGANAAQGAGNSILQGANAAGQIRSSGYNSLASGIGSGINNALFYNYMGNQGGGGGGFYGGSPGSNPYLMPYG